MDNTTDKIYVPMTKEEYLEWSKSKEAKQKSEPKPESKPEPKLDSKRYLKWKT